MGSETFFYGTNKKNDFAYVISQRNKWDFAYTESTAEMNNCQTAGGTNEQSSSAT